MKFSNAKAMDVLIKNVQDNSFVELYKRSSRSIAAMEKLTPGVYQIYHHLLDKHCCSYMLMIN